MKALTVPRWQAVPASYHAIDSIRRRRQGRILMDCGRWPARSQAGSLSEYSLKPQADVFASDASPTTYCASWQYSDRLLGRGCRAGTCISSPAQQPSPGRPRKQESHLDTVGRIGKNRQRFRGFDAGRSTGSSPFCRKESQRAALGVGVLSFHPALHARQGGQRHANRPSRVRH